MENNDKLAKEATLEFIREVLQKEGSKDGKDHYRFEMSGYESETGKCTLHNQMVLNKFAYLGLYDYTTYLFLDFYKGTPTLYMQYFYDPNNTICLDLSGYGTTEIIYKILKLTVYSGKSSRRR